MASDIEMLYNVVLGVAVFIDIAGIKWSFAMKGV